MRSHPLDGVYRLTYCAQASDAKSEGGLAIVRDGRIFGSDRFGGIFDGHFDLEASKHPLATLHLTVPPNGELVTGFTAGADGASVKLSTVLDLSAPTRIATVEIHGQTLEVRIERLGQPPG